MAGEPVSRTFEYRGGTVHYREGGEGPPVVLVHGWIESSWCWLRLFDQVSSQYRCHALDLLGFGQTTIPEEATEFDIQAQVDLVLQFLETRVEGPVHLVGHSMGGMIALQVAVKRPELLRSLTLASAPIDGPNAVARLLQIVGLPVIRDSTFRLLRSREVARFLSNYFVHKVPVPEQMIEDAQRVPHKALFGSANSILSTNMEPLLGRVKVPALVLFGDRDRVVDIGQGALAADRIRNAEFRIFRSCGHCPQIEEPWHFANAVRQFWRDVSGVPPQLLGVSF